MTLQVQRVKLWRVQIALRASFRHAQSERRGTDAVIVALEDGAGHTGHGEILPRPYVTGETVEAALTELAPAAARAILDRSFGSTDAVIAFLGAALDGAGRDLATFSGFEIALLDLAGQTFSFSLASVLGGARGAELPGGVVIGFERETAGLARYCAVLRFSGKRHVKVKVGLADDLERLRQIGGVLEGVALRLDANGAYGSADEAIAALGAMKSAGVRIESVEQPLAAGDDAGHRRVREATGIPVMADESLVTLVDAERLIAAGAADIFNIRLGKVGGVLAARRLVERARAAGLGVHLGTLVGETGILSRAAEVFGRSVPGFACLDGKAQNEQLLAEDLLEDPAQARAADLDRPGLGVRVSPERLARHAAGAPVELLRSSNDERTTP